MAESGSPAASHASARICLDPLPTVRHDICVGGNEESRRVEVEVARREDREASERRKATTPARAIADVANDDSPTCSCHGCREAA
jgi:hypothetical protein